MIKVMLVEDEEKIRHILKKMIEKLDGFEVVAEVESFATAIQAFTDYRPETNYMKSSEN